MLKLGIKYKISINVINTIYNTHLFIKNDINNIYNINKNIFKNPKSQN